MRRIVWLFGGIGGGVLVLMMFLTMPLSGGPIDFDTAEWLGYLSMIVALSVIFVGIKSYRDKVLGGQISFGKGVQVGLLITLVASAIYVLGWLIYLNTVGGNFMDAYHQHSVEKLQHSGLSPAEFQEKLAEMEKFRELYRNPLVQIGVTFLEIFPVGLIITLISAAILRKKPAIQTLKKH